ncbi:MAG: chorismate synthase [Flavobacteriales bacterium]|nr:chorismate synthase [Flavobacteriales bacterium]
MAGNSFGTIFKLTTFGESHGEAIGGIVDGCPSGLEIKESFIQSELDKRRPGQSALVSQRKENDKVHFISGIYEGKTTGTPIAFIIYNTNKKSDDYAHLKDIFRPSHADYTYFEKYGICDFRGGGRASARETACRVVGGAIAKLLLRKYKIKIHAYVSCVGNIELLTDYKKLNIENTFKNPVHCPDIKTAAEIEKCIKKIKKQGDTVGGKVSCFITNMPVGLGEPVFDKLHADLGKAMLSINAAKGFEYGSGFSASSMLGSIHNDIFIAEKNKKIRTKTNFSGGIQGGISNGEDIFFNVAFKPVASIMQEQQSVNKKAEIVKFKIKGRHDPCVVPRAVVIVEAMAALVIVDHLLRAQTINL